MEQTEPNAMTFLGVIFSDLLSIFEPEKRASRKPTARQQELRDLIESMTLASRNGRTYHKGLHQALDETYSAREVDKAIRALRRRRVLNEHKEGPDDTAYSHNNKFLAWYESLPYL